MLGSGTETSQYCTRYKSTSVCQCEYLITLLQKSMYKCSAVLQYCIDFYFLGKQDYFHFNKCEKKYINATISMYLF